MPEFWDIFYFLNDEATESISWYTIFQLYFLFHVFLCTSMLLCSSLFLTPMTVCDDVELVGKKILLLTAHPDDECMFFAPSVVRLSKTSEVFILCVTTGNYYNQGELRSRELRESCKVLGVEENHVQILDDSAFQDDPNAKWDLDRLCDQIKNTINSFKPDFIFTFDEHGVSGHPNHIDVSKAARQLVQEGNFSHGIVRLFELETVNVIRKYVSFLELPFSLGTDLFFVTTFPELAQGQRAMFQHWSQMMWFRVLYIKTSRYMMVNTYYEVEFY